jgi:uncharacterized delta-60 repeat protein
MIKVVLGAALLAAASEPCFSNDGNLDATFGFFGQVELTPSGISVDYSQELRLRADAQHRIVGCIHTLDASNHPVPWLFRLLPNGGSDPDFAGTGSKFVPVPATATGLACDALAVYGDGRILLASLDGSNQYILRFKADGSADETFNGTGMLKIARTGATNDFIYAAAIAPDNSAYIAYTRSTANGSRFVVRRILDNGTVDSAFASGTGVALFDGFAIRTGVTARDDNVTNILLAPGGGIVVTGTTEPKAGGSADFAAARLTATGDPDLSFGTGAARIVAFDHGQTNTDRCYSSTLDAHGRLVMVGYSQRATAGDYDFAVVRLLGNGAPDTSLSGDGKVEIAFDLGGAGEDIGTSVAIQSDNRIVVAGYARHVTGTSGADWAVARLLDGGALDATFGPANNGKQTYSVNLAAPNNDYLDSMAANGSDFVLAGDSTTSASTQSVILGRIRTDLIFANAFGD